MRFIVIICICFNLNQFALADCPSTQLYCFDTNKFNIGNITVDQCWKWSRTSCLPCAANTFGRGFTKLIFNKYIQKCRHYYPETSLVLNTKTVFIREIKYFNSEMNTQYFKRHFKILNYLKMKN